MEKEVSKPFTSFRDKRRLKSDPEPTQESQPVKKKSRVNKRAYVGLLIVGLFVSGFLLWLFFKSASSVVSYVITKNPTIAQTDQRTNILLLGMAGGKHDGALLTDSIIVASYNNETKRAVLISIPRDLWLESINEKVNAAYEYGLFDRNGGDGLKFASDKIDDILGIPIHYAVRIDFGGFEQAIDTVGGIEVDVPTTFDDYMYPITGEENNLCDYTEQEIDIDEAKSKELNVPQGKRKYLVEPSGKVATDPATLKFPCRYEHLHFDKGVTQMDGETALKFVRSRHGNNNEGSDFARSRRQQLVIEAFKQKALSLETLANPTKAWGLLDSFGKSLETNIPKDKFFEFYDMAKNVKTTDSIVLGDLGNGKSLLISPPVSKYGAWTLIPPDYDFSKVQLLVKAAVDATDSASFKQAQAELLATPTPSPRSTARATARPSN